MTATNDLRPTAVLLCPGRGSYGKPELGSITRLLRPGGPVAEALAEADRLRAAAGQPTITELDTAEQFRPRLHLEGKNAAELIHFATLAHVEVLREEYRIVAVAGNSLGWYTALPAAGSVVAAPKSITSTKKPSCSPSTAGTRVDRATMSCC